MPQHCMKYMHDYKCDDRVFNKVDCSKCAYRTRTLVDLSDVEKVIAESVDKEEMLKRLSELNSVSSEYLSTAGADKLASSS